MTYAELNGLLSNGKRPSNETVAYIGAKCRELRRRLNMTQEEMSKTTHYTREYIALIETGKCWAPKYVYTLERFMEFPKLFGGDD